MPGSALVKFSENVWTAEGPPVNFFGFAYPVRMSIIRLATGGLFVHSPIAPTADLLAAVDGLGPVKFLISPNRIHHLYLGDWREIYPDAKMFSSPGLARKRRDLAFDGALGDGPEPGWAAEIDQLIFAGSKALDEVVFFHKPSKTLILADLIENFDENWFTGPKGWLARRMGIVAPNGKAPLDFRFSFLFGKKAARRSLARMKGWAPDHIILSHGHCIRDNGVDELNRAFRWLA